MRYIGNKTRLLPFIVRTVGRLGIGGGTIHDAFAGTASVGQAFRQRGWRVHTSDILASSYVFQQAYVVADRSGTDLDARALDLTRADPRVSFISRHFSPLGGRMFFTEENAARIDAARELLESWRNNGEVSGQSYYLLLAAVIEGTDRVANTAGVYASFMKGWQVNARRTFRVVIEQPAGGALPATAHLMDAAAAAAIIGDADLIYIDPPYNARQYVAYYHIPEILARGWFDREPAVRGKVGLLAGPEGRSDWSHGRRVKRLFSGLLSATGAKHALVSFGSEGHLSADALTETLLSHSVDGKVSRFAQRYRRYRADGARTGKTYHADAVTEQLFHIRLR